MKYIIYILIFLSVSCQSQNNIIGGGCDGCELMYIDMPNNIEAIHTNPAWHSQSQKLIIRGKVYQIDGKTPAKNVIVYYWQTNDKGIYPAHTFLNKKPSRHGKIRGWVKSDNDGHYEIRTIKPKAYPNRNIPAHIHLSIKEPQLKTEYYVDELVFDYDPLLTTSWRKSLLNRGGSGILRSLKSDDVIIAEHNIILGLNIPNYPSQTTHTHMIQSGQAIGEDFQSITPFHAWGPDKGTTTCPVCRYGRNLGILYFVTDLESQDVLNWINFLEQQSQIHNKLLKAYLIYAPINGITLEQSKLKLMEIGKKLDVKDMALTIVPSFEDKESDIYLAKINPKVANTFIIYKNRNIINKYINLEATTENFTAISHFLVHNIDASLMLPIDTRKE